MQFFPFTNTPDVTAFLALLLGPLLLSLMSGLGLAGFHAWRLLAGGTSRVKPGKIVLIVLQVAGVTTKTRSPGALAVPVSLGQRNGQSPPPGPAALAIWVSPVCGIIVPSRMVLAPVAWAAAAVEIGAQASGFVPPPQSGPEGARSPPPQPSNLHPYRQDTSCVRHRILIRNFLRRVHHRRRQVPLHIPPRLPWPHHQSQTCPPPAPKVPWQEAKHWGGCGRGRGLSCVGSGGKETLRPMPITPMAPLLSPLAEAAGASCAITATVLDHRRSDN